MINDMIEMFVGQCRNVDQSIQVAVIRAEGEEALVEVEYKHQKFLIALVSAPNISSCRGLWWYSYPELLKENIYAVAVFYGPAKQQGAFWADSQGNPYKDDYRRIIRTGVGTLREGPQILRNHAGHPNIFEEPQYLLSEENLKRLLTFQQLVPRAV